MREDSIFYVTGTCAIILHCQEIRRALSALFRPGALGTTSEFTFLTNIVLIKIVAIYALLAAIFSTVILLTILESFTAYDLVVPVEIESVGSFETLADFKVLRRSSIRNRIIDLLRYHIITKLTS